MTRARDVANLIGSGNYSSTTFTATAGQTAFTISHTQGFVQVFMNGLLLDLTVDYTSNGSAITLTSGAAVGDEIEVVKYNTFSVGDALNQAAADTRYVNTTGDTMSGDLTVDTNTFHVDVADNRVGIGTSTPSYKLHTVLGAGESDGVGFLNAAGQGINFYTDSTASNADVFFDQGASGSALAFKQAGSERMRINSSGEILIGITSAPSAGSGGSAFKVDSNGRRNLFLSTSSSNNQGLIYFLNPNGEVGSITTNGSATAYNTSSDYRLKENVSNISDGITRVKQLAPKRFNFIADADTTVDGFLAHEAQTVVPEAITGTKDEVDDDDNPVMQSIDHSKLVPLLTAALQEAIAKIETLETKVAALEGG